MPIELINYINNKSKLLNSYKDLHSAISGLTLVNGKPMIISSIPITDSDLMSPAEGTLIMGQYLDNTIIDKIEQMTDTKIKLNKIGTYGEVKGEINKQPDFSKKDIYIDRSDRNNLIMNSIIKGLEGEPLFILEMKVERNIYNHALQSIQAYITVFIACLLITFVVSMILLAEFVIRPVEMSKGFLLKVVNINGR